MLWICQACTTAYSVGAPGCPQCGADDHADEGTEQGVTAEVVAPDEEDTTDA